MTATTLSSTPGGTPAPAQGRPRNEPAEAAPARTWQPCVKFHGSECGKCGGTLRYERGGKCVYCTLRRDKRSPSYVGDGTGLSAGRGTGEKFEGNPCLKCGETLHYVKTRKCVNCDRMKSKRRYAANPEVVARGGVHARQVVYTITALVPNRAPLDLEVPIIERTRKAALDEAERELTALCGEFPGVRFQVLTSDGALVREYPRVPEGAAPSQEEATV